MKLSYVMTAALFGLGTIGLAVASQGCSSSKAEDDAAAASGGARPPSKPTAAAADTSTRSTFALRKLYLGDTDRAGKSDSIAWKKFGYNLDGKNTRSGAATDVCKPKGGAVVVDGDNGIDNAFGGTILPLLTPLLADPSKTASTALEDGSFTVMLDLRGLSTDPKQTNTGVTGQLFAGGTFGENGAKPKWDGADNWPLLPELLADQANIEKGSKVVFGDAYVTNGTWVSGSGADIQLAIAFSGVSLNLRVLNAFVVGAHDGAGKMTNGVVAGYLGRDELIDTLGKVAGRINTTACPGKSSYKVIVEAITAAADMRLDKGLSGECDAISIGIGFDAQKIGTPTKVSPPAPASPDPCLTADGDAGASDAAKTD